MQVLKKLSGDSLNDIPVSTLLTTISYHIDLSKDYEALGGAYNAFSLNENGGSLPLAIERVGQASDGTYLGLQELVYPHNQWIIHPYFKRY